MPVLINGSTDTISGATSIAGTGNAGITIDSSGYARLPYIPCFYAYSSGGVSTTTTTTALVFSNTRVNRGNHYSTSTGRFTAPIAGYYQFHAHVLQRHSSSGGYGEVGFAVNNVNQGRLAYTHVVYSSEHIPTHWTQIRYLNAGDYVSVCLITISSGTDFYYGENLGHFSGKLLG